MNPFAVAASGVFSLVSRENPRLYAWVGFSSSPRKNQTKNSTRRPIPQNAKRNPSWDNYNSAPVIRVSYPDRLDETHLRLSEMNYMGFPYTLFMEHYRRELLILPSIPLGGFEQGQGQRTQRRRLQGW